MSTNSSRGESSRSTDVASTSAELKVGRTLLIIFVVGTLINYPWELAQTPLYAGMESFSRMLWHCFLASLGDGLLVLLIFAAGWIVFRRQRWFIRPDVRGYLLMLTVGLILAVAIEWIATGIAGQWRYAERMPRLLGIGLAPVVQMLVLPPLIFYITARWCGHTASKQSRRI